MNPILAMRAWEEILLDILGPFVLEKDARPDWLVNPATRRRLKLDRYYPELRLAIRFTGLSVKGHRKSVWEEKEDQSREEIRKALCDANGVTLVTIEPLSEHPADEVSRLCRSLSRTSRRIAASKWFSHREKAVVLEKLAHARERCRALSHRLRSPEALIPLAERHRDRELSEMSKSRDVPPKHKTDGTGVPVSALKPGAKVFHDKFGPGVVVSAETDRDADSKISIRFGDEERTFLVNLVRNHLTIHNRRGEKQR